MMSDSSAPVSASRSQVSQHNTVEHRSLDRLGLLLHRRNSGFSWTGSGSVVLASPAQQQGRLWEESSTGLDGTTAPMRLPRVEVWTARG